MEITKKRRLSDIILGLFLLSHPGPVLLHIIAVTLFALLAAWPHFAWGIIALVVAAHAAMQLSIAMLNDYCDRQLDAESKPGKPIPRGLVRPVEALFCGLLLIVVMVLLLLPLHRLALLISLCYLALGQGYNLGLKSTPLSGIVFALAMPLIPLYAFAGVGRTLPFLFWLVPVGCLLGVALNLANSLPDIPGDATRGARTLAKDHGQCSRSPGGISWYIRQRVRKVESYTQQATHRHQPEKEWQRATHTGEGVEGNERHRQGKHDAAQWRRFQSQVISLP